MESTNNPSLDAAIAAAIEADNAAYEKELFDAAVAQAVADAKAAREKATFDAAVAAEVAKRVTPPTA